MSNFRIGCVNCVVFAMIWKCQLKVNTNGIEFLFSIYNSNRRKNKENCRKNVKNIKKVVQQCHGFVEMTWIAWKTEWRGKYVFCILRRTEHNQIEGKPIRTLCFACTRAISAVYLFYVLRILIDKHKKRKKKKKQTNNWNEVSKWSGKSQCEYDWYISTGLAQCDQTENPVKVFTILLWFR